ncbi:hypothetical protein [Psychrobacillus faecigallinarum]|uniref:hypothetical protein n=1 Tax=Psychrobacillus faecigallinarum TaxID=2762235 RepID=UPI001CD84859|nr:hypothetical protein [Psychrobacillus faecigallinarum]
MVECSGCMVRDLVLEFKIEGETNFQVLPDVMDFIQNRALRLEENGRYFTLK